MPNKALYLAEDKRLKEDNKPNKSFLVIIIGISVSIIIGRLALYILPKPIGLVIGMIGISCFLIFFYFLAKYFPPLINSLIGALFVIIGNILIYIVLLTLDLFSIIFFMMPSISLLTIGILLIIDCVKFYYKNKPEH